MAVSTGRCDSAGCSLEKMRRSMCRRSIRRRHMQPWTTTVRTISAARLAHPRRWEDMDGDRMRLPGRYSCRSCARIACAVASSMPARLGAFVSLDDGDSWQSLRLNLPNAMVNDLLVHGNDLIAATQGRAIWVLDDLTPLRQLSDNVFAGPGASVPSRRCLSGSAQRESRHAVAAGDAAGAQSPRGSRDRLRDPIPVRWSGLSRDPRFQRDGRAPVFQRRQDRLRGRGAVFRRGLASAGTASLGRAGSPPFRVGSALRASEERGLRLLDRGDLGRRHPDRARRNSRAAGEILRSPDRGRKEPDRSL